MGWLVGDWVVLVGGFRHLSRGWWLCECWFLVLRDLFDDAKCLRVGLRGFVLLCTGCAVGNR